MHEECVLIGTCLRICFGFLPSRLFIFVVAAGEEQVKLTLSLSSDNFIFIANVRKIYFSLMYRLVFEMDDGARS